MPEESENCYEVRVASDSRAVSQVCVTADFIRRAKEICAEERDLIAAKIASDRIPFPEVLPRQRPRVEFAARRVDSAAAIPSMEPVPAFGRKEARAGRRGLLAWGRLLGLVRSSKRILDVAKPGLIVIVTRKPEGLLLGCLLWLQGRKSLTKALGYGFDGVASPRYLVRPAKNTFVFWISYDTDYLGKIGAVVFLGGEDEDVDADLEALAAAHHKPPVVLASVIDTGSYELAAVYPRGLRREDAGNAARVRISVVIVSFNQAAFLEAAIRSVVSQNYADLEIIIVDGGSTDGSIEIIETYRSHFAHVIIEPDEGQSDALNKGLARATGEVMNWLCSDDLLEPGALARISEAYLASGADLIVGGCIRIGESRQDELIRHHTSIVVGRNVQLDALDMLDYMGSWHLGNYFYQPEVFFTRRIWEASGGFIKKHLHYAMDYDMWLRMALAGASIYHIPAMIACSRVHAEQKTRLSGEYLHLISQLLEEYEDLIAALEAADRAAERDHPSPRHSRSGG